MNDSERTGLLTQLSNIQKSQVSYLNIVIRFPFLKYTWSHSKEYINNTNRYLYKAFYADLLLLSEILLYTSNEIILSSCKCQ